MGRLNVVVCLELPSSVGTAMTLARLCKWTGSLEPSLFAYGTGILCSCPVCMDMTRKYHNQSPYDKTNKMICAPSEDSDQPGHPLSLIRIYAVRMKKHSALKRTLKTMIRLGGCPGWSVSSLGAHIILLVLSYGDWLWYFLVAHI